MKKILVPTDFSDFANYATEIAASICRKTGGRLYLMHIMDMPSYVDPHGAAYESIPEGIAALRHTKQKFKNLLKEPYLKDINVGEVLQFNDVFTSISKFADDNDVDLIVMGSHGVRGLKEMFLGSNTERIVRTANCPVLTIKKQNDDYKLINMVFASEFTEDTYEAYEGILKIASYFNAHIHLLKVITKVNFEPYSKSMELMNAFAKRMDLKKFSTFVFNANDVEEGILEFAQMRNAEMIAVTTHARSNFSQVFNDSVAENLVNHSNIPVLSMKIS